MSKSQLVFRAGLLCLLLICAWATPAQGAAAQAEPACDTVDFYFKNAAHVPVFVDITNWSNGTRWLGILQPNQVATFSLAPGMFEFWANAYDGDWDVSGGDVYAGCTDVAIYLKVTWGPEFTVFSKQR